MSTTIEKKNKSNANDWSQEPWNRVKEAIHIRWPHVGDQELNKLDCDIDEVVAFLKEFTDSAEDEIESVVTEFAPPRSPLQRVTKVAGSINERVAPPVQSAVERAQYELDEHRGAATGLVFVAGILVGVLTTLTLRKPAPPTSRFSDYMPSRWSS